MSAQAGPGAKVLEKLRSMGLSDDFCPVPFFSTIFEANGKVCLCRQKGNEFGVGDIRSQPFERIWNGEKIRSIRAEFLSGNVRTCRSEIDVDHCNLSPEHLEYLDLIDLKEVQERLPQRITPNFNGHCNLRCEMCHVWKFPDKIYDQIGFWKKLEEEILPVIREIDHFSGEPFVQKDTYRLIRLVSRINPQIIWSFTTNGNWRLKGAIQEHLDTIRIRNLIFSIDSLDPIRYARVREKGILARALKAIEDCAAYEQERISRGLSSLGLSVNMTVQQENLMDVPALVKFCREHELRLSIRTVTEPRHLSIERLEKQQLIAALEHFIECMPPKDLMRTYRITKFILDQVSPIDRARLLVLFQQGVLRK